METTGMATFEAAGFESAVRKTEMRLGARRSIRGRRRGQALLLAVLLMVLVALLGTTFITVIALNLSQTARFVDKQQARQAAFYGADAVGKRIVDKGLAWRPDNPGETPLPAANNSTYYDQFDMAQGWAARGFIKYPDPRGLNSGDGAPNYMVKVERVALGDSDNPRGDRTNDLRITIIGRSFDNPAAFEKLVRYQPGTAKNAVSSAMRTVSNWNFQDKTVPVATVSAVATSPALSITLQPQQGRFPSTVANGSYYVMIGDPRSNQVRGAVVQSYSGTGTMTLTGLAGTTPVVGERVEMAAAVGAPLLLDYNNTITSTADEKVDFLFSSDAAPTASAGGANVNGGLLWFGDVHANNLRSPQSADYQNTVPGVLRSSGLMQVVNAATASPAVPAVSVAGSYSTGTANAQVPAGARLAPSSADTAFPGNWSGMTPSQKAQLTDDGWNRLAGSQQAERQVKPFTPPDITRGASGDFSRYLQLSKYSDPATPGDPITASHNGYGQGIYINNPEDKERYYDSNPDGDPATLDGRLIEMTQARLREMWFNSPGTSAYRRDSNPVVASSATASLEDQHLRGWIGPEEFRARGPLIELNGDNPATITITLDSRDDSPAFNKGTASHKGWHDINGTLLGDATVGGVYQKTFPWPANGVIFTEGNVRVRGVAPNAPRSLTVVSMNNAYIEGSLSAGANRKVLMLARRNVVLNPTGVISRIDNQTRLSAQAAVGNTQIQVFDATGFRPGDIITFADTTRINPPGSVKDPRIVSISGNTINISSPITTIKAPLTTAVRTKSDVITSSNVPSTDYNRLDDFSNVLQRRFAVSATDAASGATQIALSHNAQKIAAFNVSVTAGTGTPTSALLSNKKLMANPQSTVIGYADKLLRVQYGVGASGTDVFPDPAPADNAAALAYKLPDLKINIESRRSSPAWKYSANALGGYNVPTITEKPAFYFLASMGNRVRRVGDTSVSTAGTVDIVPTGGFSVPMATSVVMAVNGSPATIRTAAASGYEEVRQFGFNPIHGVSSTDAAELLEDVLTSDQSFYTNALAGPNDYLLDSRLLASSSFQAGVNSLQMSLNPLAEAHFRATGSTTNVPRIPYYRLARIKLENVSLTAGEVEKVQPAQTLDVRAFVYAQEGSWIVIPGDVFDDNARNATSGTFSFNRDLNRDGIMSRTEQIAGYRYGRYNYEINFTGAISENQSPIVQDAGTIKGEVADWMNKWSCVQIDAGNWNGTGATFRNNLVYNSSAVAPAINNFPNINYKFDDDVAKGKMDSDPGFQIPVAPGMLYGG